MTQFKDMPDALQITLANVNHARHQVPETTAGTRTSTMKTKAAKIRRCLDLVVPSLFTPLKYMVKILMFFGRMGWRRF